jgi:hypothetical protein
MLTGGASRSQSAFFDTLKDTSLNASEHNTALKLSLGTVQQNPLSSLPSLPPWLELSSFKASAVVYQRVDPRPFAPTGFELQEDHHREIMMCAVMRPAKPAHEDFAIVCISPLPSNPLHFPIVHEVV